MTISDKGLELIKKYEGFRSKVYKDAVGLPTIGFGTLIDTKEEQYLKTKIITEAEATQLLKYDVAKFEKAINDLVNVTLNQNQYDSLCTFTYNVGIGNFKSSTLLKLINQSKFKEAAEQFVRWNKAGGKELVGLTKRRLSEKELFLS